MRSFERERLSRAVNSTGGWQQNVWLFSYTSVVELQEDLALPENPTQPENALQFPESRYSLDSDCIDTISNQKLMSASNYTPDISNLQPTNFQHQ
ncbi:MAG TPA: hypothetical protein DD473_06100 [Planctomycetaceae bacterium]|nr:hypothetical protein [Planctomycetaceae bacterium]